MAVSVKTALIGFTGFVGSHLRAVLPATPDLYNSKNIQDIAGKVYDTLYFAGLPATKWSINKKPEQDIRNLLSIQIYLAKCSVKKFILISTIDVYNHAKLRGQTEEVVAVSEEPYGRHRWIMEEWVKLAYRDYHIIRLPALFGVGLKKNIVYDIINDNNVHLINPNTSFQWYNIENLVQDIDYMVAGGIKVLNVFTQPLPTADLIAKCFPMHTGILERGATMPTPPNLYDQHTSYAKHLTYCAPADEVNGELAAYVALQQTINTVSKRLVVSNLAWDKEWEDRALHVLSMFGVRALEIAITKHMSWDDMTQESLLALKGHYNSQGFDIYSLQALLYGLPINLFSAPEAFVGHMKKVITSAHTLGAKVLVFGSPRNRLVPDDISTEAALEMFLTCMRELVEFASAYDVVICLEANAPGYGCNFVTTVQEARGVISHLKHPNFKLNVDTGNALMANERLADDVEGIVQDAGHFQVSEGFLKPLLSTAENNVSHRKVVKKLLNAGYSGMLSLEMLPCRPEEFYANIKEFVSLCMQS